MHRIRRPFALGLAPPLGVRRKHTSGGPLEGYKVVDMTRILAGPFCTMLLGDLGADVIKVEHPKRGDDTRAWGPPFKGYERSVVGAARSDLHSDPPQFPGESAYYLCANRNKRSVAVDMKTHAGRSVILDLARTADVFVENFVPGKLAEYGLAYEDLAKANPKLVYASISGYGATGPYSTRPGYDVIIEAEAGLMHITGEAAGPPVKVGVAVTDVMTGLYAYSSVLAALLARAKTNRGQHIDASLLQTQAAMLANVASSYLVGGKAGRRWGTAHPSIVPYEVFATRDGKICIGAGNDRQFQTLCALLGCPELAADALYRTNADRVHNRAALVDLLNERLGQHSTADLLGMLEGSGMPFGPVNDIAQTFAHPQIEARNVVRTVDHPVAGRLKLVGPAVEFSDSDVSVRLPPPMLGQHTEEVLRDVLGYSEDKIRAIVREGGAAMYNYNI